MHAPRLEAYAELAAFLERERLYIERTEPVIVIGEGQPPPDALSDEDWIKMQGRRVGLVSGIRVTWLR